MIELLDGILIIFGVAAALLALYLCVRLAGKAWYRSKREEEGATVRRIKDHFRNNQQQGGQ